MKTTLDRQILTAEDTMRKIKRMAFEMYERNFTETELVLAGIVDNGLILAHLLAEELQQISDLKVSVMEIKLNKRTPTQSDISLSVQAKELENKVVIMVDDVHNTGRTLAYSLKPFLDIRIKKLQTAVLVDRDHKDFPIAADYIGYALSTTLKEHITVDLSASRSRGVYLD